jgi:MarR family transcriptional regulator, protease production regulatory protein HPr
MKKTSQNYSCMDGLLFNLKLMQLSKALWRAIENDWEQWLKSYNLNINEYHILCLASDLSEVSVSEMSKLGAMHISTVFNFSKKLKEQGYIQLSKKERDKRNTYIKLTQMGEDFLIDILKNYKPSENRICTGSLPLHNLSGKFPTFPEVGAIMRNVGGNSLFTIIDHPLDKIKEKLIEEDEFLKNSLK